MSSPFYIAGCVRSGTTLLRNLLRLHPKLESPEETHYYRWADPFGTPRFRFFYANNGSLKNSRQLDGIDDEEFFEILDASKTRRELSDGYGQLFLEKRHNPEGRWFDKTPQNIYGIFLIRHEYPDAKFIHIYRNPLNVAASLKLGRSMPKMPVYAGVNYWMDYGDALLEVGYEALVEDAQNWVRRILEFVGEAPEMFTLPRDMVHKEKALYPKALEQSEIDYVLEHCEPYLTQYGYR